MHGSFPELTRRFDAAKPLGYLNFAGGSPDSRFRKFLADVRAFLAERPDEPALRAAVAAAHLRVAQIGQEMGDAGAARAEYERGFAAYAELLAERPDETP